MNAEGPLEPSEVQSAQQIRELESTLLQLELDHPVAPLAIGGPMCWSYDIDDAITVLRRAILEARLGLLAGQKLEQVKGAAHIVFAAVEDRLRPFAGADSAVPAHLYPWRLQTMAKVVLLDVLGKPSAVRAVQIHAAEGDPLTVCFGLSRRIAYQAPLRVKGLRAAELRNRARDALASQSIVRLPGVSYSHGDGCGRTHHESRSHSRLFKLYCERCTKHSSNRQKRLESEFWAEAQGRLGARGPAKCSVCDETFERTRPNQKRCLRCRRNHRSSAH